jgi:hypothetical protein
MIKGMQEIEDGEYAERYQKEQMEEGEEQDLNMILQDEERA